MPEHCSSSIAHCLPLGEEQRGHRCLACSVTWCNSLNLSEPQYSHPQIERDKTLTCSALQETVWRSALRAARNSTVITDAKLGSPGFLFCFVEGGFPSSFIHLL